MSHARAVEVARVFIQSIHKKSGLWVYSAAMVYARDLLFEFHNSQ